MVKAGHETNGIKRYLVGVAVSITVTLLVQTATLIWWVGRADLRLGDIEVEQLGITTAFSVMRDVLAKCCP